jgi:hypothetical protein
VACRKRPVTTALVMVARKSGVLDPREVKAQSGQHKYRCCNLPVAGVTARSSIRMLGSIGVSGRGRLVFDLCLYLASLGTSVPLRAQ